MNHVLITGGTSGIGFYLARIFAKNGYNIVIVSGNLENLKHAKTSIEKEFSTSVVIIEQDLSKLGAAQKVYDYVKELKIDINMLINNAGVGVVGSFVETDMQVDENMMILNMINLVELSKLFLADMYVKKEGKILNVASTGAFQPGPFISIYYASKAFVLSFSRAIRKEASRNGVTVSTLCPGATKTEFFHRAGKNVPKSAMEAEKVANIAYKKFMKNKDIIVPGLFNKLVRCLPITIRMSAVEKIQINLKKQFDKEL